jgi:hypothetical protein
MVKVIPTPRDPGEVFSFSFDTSVSFPYDCAPNRFARKRPERYPQYPSLSHKATHTVVLADNPLAHLISLPKYFR